MNNDSGMNGKRDFQGKNRETNRLVNRVLIATILLVVVALLGVCACGYETLRTPHMRKRKKPSSWEERH